ncbi:MAG: hypothetical protein V5A68_01405 [Candidatus Thermoplasmatota archaeon]
MKNLKQSMVVKNLLNNLLNVSSRRTNKENAITTINKLIRENEDTFDFLKGIEIQDNLYNEENEIVSVMSEIDKADPIKVGSFLKYLVTNMQNSLGDTSSHFFIKEIKNKIDETEHTYMKEDMGLDLGLIQLESEVHDLHKTLKKRK